MSEPRRTVVDCLRAVQALLDKDVLSPSEPEAARAALEVALSAIQVARCEAIAALDRL